MNPRRFLLDSAIVALLAAMLPPGSAAAGNPAETAPPPSTQPAGGQVDREMRKLMLGMGSPDPSIREASSAKLKAMGKEALPALTEAASMNDPEIRVRAQELLRRLERKELPIGPETPGRSSRSMRISVKDGESTIEITTERQKVSIQEIADGSITMDVTAMEDGQEVGEAVQVSARNAEELKAEHPDAFALYEEHKAKNGIQMVAGGWGGGGRVVVGGGGGRIMIQPNAPLLRGDLLQVYRGQLAKAFVEANVPEEMRKEILADLARVEQLKQPLGAETEAEAAKRLEEYSAAVDKLRAKLAEQKLPDPGEALALSLEDRMRLRRQKMNR